MMDLAQKKPSLNWVKVFHPRIMPVCDTAIPEMSKRRIALIRMRRIVFFIAFSIVREHENQLVMVYVTGSWGE